MDSKRKLASWTHCCVDYMSIGFWVGIASGSVIGASGWRASILWGTNHSRWLRVLVLDWRYKRRVALRRVFGMGVKEESKWVWFGLLAGCLQDERGWWVKNLSRKRWSTLYKPELVFYILIALRKVETVCSPNREQDIAGARLCVKSQTLKQFSALVWPMIHFD